MSYDIHGTELKIINQHIEPDVITDLAWNFYESDFLVTCCGNGTYSLWQFDKKIKTIPAHSKEISSVDWKESISTSSWDGTLTTVSKTVKF